MVFAVAPESIQTLTGVPSGTYLKVPKGTYLCLLLLGKGWDGMPHDIHPHLKNYKHTGPWESLPVCYLGDLDLRSFSYIRVRNGVGFRTENMSCEKQGIWEFVAGGRTATAMCTLLPLLRSKIHLFFFADCWPCQLVSVFWPFLGQGILQCSPPENWPTPWSEQYPTMNWEKQ